jgi:hypothetical protein
MINEDDLRAAYRAEVEHSTPDGSTATAILHRARRQQRSRGVAAAGATAVAVAGVVFSVELASSGSQGIVPGQQPGSVPVTTVPRPASPREQHAALIRCLRAAGWVVNETPPSPVPAVVPSGQTPSPGATAYVGGFGVAVPPGRAAAYDADEARCMGSATLATPASPSN